MGLSGSEGSSGHRYFKSRKLDGFVRQRRENAAYFMEKIGGLGFQLQTETGSSFWFGFAVILPEDEAGRRTWQQNIC